MSFDTWKRRSIQSLIDDEIIVGHKDGNYGSSYPRASEFGPSGVPLLTAKNVDDGGRIDFDSAARLNEKKASTLRYGFIETNDVLLSHNATVGRVALVPKLDEPILVGTSLTYFRVDSNKLLPKYLATFFRGEDFQRQLQAVMSHSTRNQVPITAQRQLSIVLPPLPEQKAIAGVLASLDDKIELNRRMNATLEAMARALFQSWFVDFDPVRAKAAGQPPPGMDSATAALFPAEFEESELGEIPAGWQRDAIKNRTSNIQYGFTQSASAEPVGPHFLRITDIRGGQIDWSSVPFCVANEEEQEKYRVLDGDVFVARTGASTGDNLYVVNPPAAVFASYLVRFQFASRGVARFAGEFMRTSEYASHVAGTLGGSAQPNASAQALAAASAVFPTEGIANAYYQLVRPLDLKRAENDRQSRTLAGLRDALLPKLLSGELSVAQSSESVATIGGVT